VHCSACLDGVLVVHASTWRTSNRQRAEVSEAFIVHKVSANSDLFHQGLHCFIRSCVLP
jgi:hypothetical protein